MIRILKNKDGSVKGIPLFLSGKIATKIINSNADYVEAVVTLKGKNVCFDFKSYSVGELDGN